MKRVLDDDDWVWEWDNDDEANSLNSPPAKRQKLDSDGNSKRREGRRSNICHTLSKFFGFGSSYLNGMSQTKFTANDETDSKQKHNNMNDNDNSNDISSDISNERSYDRRQSLMAPSSINRRSYENNRMNGMGKTHLGAMHMHPSNSNEKMRNPIANRNEKTNDKLKINTQHIPRSRSSKMQFGQNHRSNADNIYSNNRNNRKIDSTNNNNLMRKPIANTNGKTNEKMNMNTQHILRPPPSKMQFRPNNHGNADISNNSNKSNKSNKSNNGTSESSNNNNSKRKETKIDGHGANSSSKKSKSLNKSRNEFPNQFGMNGSMTKQNRNANPSQNGKTNPKMVRFDSDTMRTKYTFNGMASGNNSINDNTQHNTNNTINYNNSKLSNIINSTTKNSTKNTINNGTKNSSNNTTNNRNNNYNNNNNTTGKEQKTSKLGTISQGSKTTNNMVVNQDLTRKDCNKSKNTNWQGSHENGKKGLNTQDDININCNGIGRSLRERSKVKSNVIKRRHHSLDCSPSARLHFENKQLRKNNPISKLKPLGKITTENKSKDQNGSNIHSLEKDNLAAKEFFNKSKDGIDDPYNVQHHASSLIRIPHNWCIPTMDQISNHTKAMYPFAVEYDDYRLQRLVFSKVFYKWYIKNVNLFKNSYNNNVKLNLKRIYEMKTMKQPSGQNAIGVTSWRSDGVEIGVFMIGISDEEVLSTLIHELTHFKLAIKCNNHEHDRNFIIQQEKYIAFFQNQIAKERQKKRVASL